MWFTSRDYWCLVKRSCTQVLASLPPNLFILSWCRSSFMVNYMCMIYGLCIRVWYYYIMCLRIYCLHNISINQTKPNIPSISLLERDLGRVRCTQPCPHHGSKEVVFVKTLGLVHNIKTSLWIWSTLTCGIIHTGPLTCGIIHTRLTCRRRDQWGVTSL